MIKLNTRGFSAVELLAIVVIVGLLGGLGWYVYVQNNKDNKKSSITNFDECVAAGNPVMESYPEQCSANGQTFTHNAQVTHTLPKEGLKVAYNTGDWTKVEPYAHQPSSEMSVYVEGITLETGQYNLSFAFGSEGKGGYTCFDLTDFDPATCTYESKVVDTVTLNGKTINIVADHYKDPDVGDTYRIWLTDKKACKEGFSCTYPSKQEFEGYASISGSFTEVKNFKDINEFVATAEVKKTIALLQDLEY